MINQQFGLTATQLEEIKSILLRTLKEKDPRVFVFGSRATGKHRQYSDLDLWIESKTEISDADMANLRDALKESDIPIQVDIVTPERCLPEYKERILGERKPWF